MVRELRIYFEGDNALRQGFLSFLEEIYKTARLRKCRISLIAAGATPVEDYRIAVQTHRDAWNILILDSEGPDDGNLSAHLCRSKGLNMSCSDSLFFMVQLMEAWFLADAEALERYYGRGVAAALRGNPAVEDIPKADVLDRLKRATRTTTKGEYHKTKHAPALLRSIKPETVRARCPNGERLFATVLRRLADEA
jgi:Domain of unknown function (DUF4276)